MAKLENRRQLLSTAAASAVTGILASTAQGGEGLSTVSLSIPQGRKLENGRWSFPIRLLAADDFSPVEGVSVEFNWWGTDGGVMIFETDADGQFTYEGNGSQEVFMLLFKAPKGSRFANSGCGFSRYSDDKFRLTIQRDGSYFPNVFLLPFHETTHTEMMPYAVSRHEHSE